MNEWFYRNTQPKNPASSAGFFHAFLVLDGIIKDGQRWYSSMPRDDIYTKAQVPLRAGQKQLGIIGFEASPLNHQERPSVTLPR
ncbi:MULTISPECIES: hypothetical protein [Pseudomonas]|uniref:Uncharacterized protein n=1 Tax=Pseudomonas fluorescens TaxID=294 RepID=A0A166PTA8_PSEFL|nr:MULTISPECIES: hypothetical protein [Pseudomonas]KZN19291.1 hypothetical protein A1D17_25165 [Pseudomonas fluorescens]